MEYAVIVTGLASVVLTVVDVRRRRPQQTVLEAWANPSGPRSASLTVFLALFFLWVVLG